MSSRLAESAGLSQFTVQGAASGIRLRSHSFYSISDDAFVHRVISFPTPLLTLRFTSLGKEFHAWPVLHFTDCICDFIITDELILQAYQININTFSELSLHIMFDSE